MFYNLLGYLSVKLYDNKLRGSIFSIVSVLNIVISIKKTNRKLNNIISILFQSI